MSLEVIAYIKRSVLAVASTSAGLVLALVSPGALYAQSASDIVPPASFTPQSTTAGQVTSPVGAGVRRKPLVIKDPPITANAKPRLNPSKVPSELDKMHAAKATTDPCTGLSESSEKRHCNNMKQVQPVSANCTGIESLAARAHCEQQIAALNTCRGSRSEAELDSCNQNQRTQRLAQGVKTVATPAVPAAMPLGIVPGVKP